jgi:hypothetical protein
LYWVFCNSEDVAAAWAFQGLKARRLTPIKMVSAEMLACSAHLEHYVGSDYTRTIIGLRDGQVDSQVALGVLNRLQYIPMSQVNASDADRQYAMQEYAAFFISWLHGFRCSVLNPATTVGLCGETRHASKWILLASKAGLQTSKYKQTSQEKNMTYRFTGKAVPPKIPVETVFTVNSSIVSKGAPPEVVAGCRRLAEMAETPLLGMDFLETSDSWTFVGATPFPNLFLGGDALLDALAKALRNGPEGGP